MAPQRRVDLSIKKKIGVPVDLFQAFERERARTLYLNFPGVQIDRGNRRARLLCAVGGEKDLRVQARM